MREYIVHVKVSGQGAHTMTSAELEKAINFGLNWGHGHSYTDANFHVSVQRTPDVTLGVKTVDGGQS